MNTTQFIEALSNKANEDEKVIESVETEVCEVEEEEEADESVLYCPSVIKEFTKNLKTNKKINQTIWKEIQDNDFLSYASLKNSQTFQLLQQINPQLITKKIEIWSKHRNITADFIEESLNYLKHKFIPYLVIF